jgi:hypothetical protein
VGTKGQSVDVDFAFRCDDFDEATCYRLSSIADFENHDCHILTLLSIAVE